MSWGELTTDELDDALAHFFGLSSAGLAQVCELIREVDARQSWMSDGARSLADWVSARMSVRHDTAQQLVSVATRLGDLPELSSRFTKGDFSLDQVDAISKMATPETEEGLIEEALRLSNTALDRRARRSNPPSVADERSVHDRRAVYLQWNLDESELKFRGNMPGSQGEILQGAVEDAADKIPINPETGMFDLHSQRLVDGLVELSATTTGDTTTTVSPPQVTVFADLESLMTDTGGVTESGHGALVPTTWRGVWLVTVWSKLLSATGRQRLGLVGTHGPFPVGYDVLSPTVTVVCAVSPGVVMDGGYRSTTFSIGLREDPPISTI